MPYRSEAVANSFIACSFDDGALIDPMKAQKLTYFAHGYYIALTDEPLIDEYFQAWKLGPVAPSLYHSLKAYRGNDIDEFIHSGGIVSAKKDADFRRVRDFVWSRYKDTPSISLSKLTHKKGYAWHRTILKNPGIQGPPILNDEIKRDFLPLVK